MTHIWYTLLYAGFHSENCIRGGDHMHGNFDIKGGGQLKIASYSQYNQLTINR